MRTYKCGYVKRSDIAKGLVYLERASGLELSSRSCSRPELGYLYIDCLGPICNAEMLALLSPTIRLHMQARITYPTSE
jgi:hypothetical protein